MESAGAMAGTAGLSGFEAGRGRAVGSVMPKVMLGLLCLVGLCLMAAGVAAASVQGNLGASSLAPEVDDEGPSASELKREAGNAGRPMVTFTGFHVFADGSARIWVRLTRGVPVEERAAKGTVTYVLRGARVPGRNNKNPLLTSYFASSVMSARLIPTKHDTELVITLKEAVSPKHRVVERPDGTASVQVDLPAPAAAK